MRPYVLLLSAVLAGAALGAGNAFAVDIVTTRDAPDLTSVRRKVNRPGGRRPLEAGWARERYGSRPSLSSSWRVLSTQGRAPVARQPHTLEEACSIQAPATNRELVAQRESIPFASERQEFDSPRVL